MPTYGIYVDVGSGGSAPKAFVWYQLVDNLGGNVPFALKWGPRGQRPPTARYLPPKSRSLDITALYLPSGYPWGLAGDRTS